MKTKIKKVNDDNDLRDDLIKAICLYTNDPLSKVLPWVKNYLKK